MSLVKNEGKRGVVLVSMSNKGLEQLLELDIVEGLTKIGNHGTMTDPWLAIVRASEAEAQKSR